MELKLLLFRKTEMFIFSSLPFANPRIKIVYPALTSVAVPREQLLAHTTRAVMFCVSRRGYNGDAVDQRHT
jgi:hypothetical protein